MPALIGRIGDSGPLVEALLMQPESMVEALKREGRPLVAPYTIKALVDTGASITALDFREVERLSLIPKGERQIHTPSTGAASVPRLVYDATIILGREHDPPLASTLEVIGGCDLRGQGFAALIGRDILGRCTFTCVGPKRSFSLSWSEANPFRA